MPIHRSRNGFSTAKQRRGAALLATVLLALTFSPLLSGPSPAASAGATAGTLDWGFSNYVNLSSQATLSVSEIRKPVSPATYDSMWHFTAGTGTYDPNSGAATINYEGGLEFGNSSRGNYGFRLTSPTIQIDSAGSGKLIADVAVRGPGSSEFVSAPVTDVVVVKFDTAGGTDNGGAVTWSVQPSTEPVPTAPAFDGAQQFPQTFMNSVTSSFEAHFRQTNAAGSTNSTNVNKMPSPMTFGLTYVPAAPAVSVTPGTEVSRVGATLAVEGTGFGDGNNGVYVQYCVAPMGTPGTAEGRPSACAPEASSKWVSNSPGATDPMGDEGSFDTTIVVAPTIGTTDCLAGGCGVFTRRDHVAAADYSLDAYRPITFAAPVPDPHPDLDPHPDPDSDPDPHPVVPSGQGNLEWGIKEGFRTYIEEGAANGEITMVDPGKRNEDETFRFPLGEGAVYGSETDVVAPFAGGVMFYGHSGALDLTLTEPEVIIDGTEGMLILDAKSPEGSSEDVEFANLDLSGVDPTADGDLITFADIPAALTSKGAESFGGFYDEGEALDPVTFTITAENDLPVAIEDVVGCLPSSARVGSTVEVCGEEFTPDEQVQIFVLSTPRFLTTVNADESGTATATVTIPADLEAGQHRIEMRGVTSGRVIQSLPFTVTRDVARSGNGSPLARTGVIGLAALAASGLVTLFIGFSLVNVRRYRAA